MAIEAYTPEELERLCTMFMRAFVLVSERDRGGKVSPAARVAMAGAVEEIAAKVGVVFGELGGEEPDADAYAHSLGWPDAPALRAYLLGAGPGRMN